MTLLPFDMCIFMVVVVVAMVCMFMCMVVVSMSMFMGPTVAPAASCLLHLLPHRLAALLLLLQLLGRCCLEPGLVNLHIYSVRGAACVHADKHTQGFEWGQVGRDRMGAEQSRRSCQNRVGDMQIRSGVVRTGW
jgi:hypothetical protein